MPFHRRQSLRSLILVLQLSFTLLVAVPSFGFAYGSAHNFEPAGVQSMSLPTPKSTAAT